MKQDGEEHSVDFNDVNTNYEYVHNAKKGATEDYDEVNVSEDTNCNQVQMMMKRITELTGDDIWDLEFNSEAEACEFYSTYAKCHGFVMRKDDIRRDPQGNIVMRQLVCNREGSREEKHLKRMDRSREHRPITRTNCAAKFRVHIDYKTSKWKVVAFEEAHNHALTPPQFVHLIPAYRKLSDSDKAQVDSLHKFGVRTCHIMGYIAGQKGGYANLGFTKKDLYNHIDRQRQAEVKDGDANAGISYLRGKAGNDPLFWGKYTVIDDERLENLFWADGSSIVDYECFGDVLAFDATYKKNKYNKPLVIFSGSNHHSQTTIFGCALISDEKAMTYKWLLETFLEAMGGKHPKAVVTDGDAAMKEAIKQVFPNTTHRLCAWHLQKNACENVKNPAFLEDFKDIIFSNYTEEEFEDCWQDMVERHGLTNNKWVLKTYENRAMWGHAYLRENFFGNIRTTSQCEGINSLIRAYIRKKNSLIEFMHNMDIALREYRNNELISDFKSFHSDPVMSTPLEKIEACAAKTFTRRIFMDLKYQIEAAGGLNIVSCTENEGVLSLRMNKFCRPRKEWEVVFDRANCKFACNCRLFESRGIPCSHIFCAMKHEHMDSIPSTLICKRWTKAAKSEFICSAPAEDTDIEKMAMLRFGSLVADCNVLCHLASKDIDSFIEIRNEIFKLISKLQLRKDGDRRQSSFKKVLGDPILVKTKGAPAKKRHGRKRSRCSNCNKTGHYYKRCPKFAVGGDGLASEQAEHPFSELDDSSKDKDTAKKEEATTTKEIDAKHTRSLEISKASNKSSNGKRQSRNREKVKNICSTQNSVKQSTTADKMDSGIRPKCHNGGNAEHEKVVAPEDESKKASAAGHWAPVHIAPPTAHHIGCLSMMNPCPMFAPYPLYPPIPQALGLPPYHGVPIDPQFHQIFGGVDNVHFGSARIGNMQKGPKGTGSSNV